jgi:hypothetical protein
LPQPVTVPGRTRRVIGCAIALDPEHISAGVPGVGHR